MEHSAANSSMAFSSDSPANEPVLDHSRDAIAHRLGGVDADRHLGELVLDHAELRDALAERLALLGVSSATDASTAFAPPTANGPELQPAEIQNVERDDVAAADLAEHVLDRHRTLSK